MDKIVEIGGHKFVLRPYTYREEVKIRDAAFINGKMSMGTWQAWVVFSSLASWDLIDEAGRQSPITLDNLLDKLNKKWIDELFEAAQEVNALGDDEKKELSAPSVSP